MSEQFVPVVSLDSVPPGSSIGVTVDGREVGIFNDNGTIYALENYCPHQGAPLVGGWIQKKTVTCPWHAWCFSLEDGSMTLGSFANVEPYDVRVEEGWISVSREPRKRSPGGDPSTSSG